MIKPKSRLLLEQQRAQIVIILVFPSFSRRLVLFLFSCFYALLFRAFCKCCSDFFLSSRPRTGLIGNRLFILLDLVEARSVNHVKNTQHTKNI